MMRPLHEKNKLYLLKFVLVHQQRDYSSGCRASRDHCQLFGDDDDDIENDNTSDFPVEKEKAVT